MTGRAQLPAAVLAVARTWIGTPYHHQSSLKGVGTDCLGLVRGVWRELYGREAELLPAYTRDWAEVGTIETLLEGARRHLIEIAPGADLPGDVVILRFKSGVPAKHCGILSSPGHIIHAVEGSGVVDVPLGAWWARRIAGRFRFPDLPLVIL